MGLDIRAYSGLVKVRAMNVQDHSGGYHDENLLRFYKNTDFPSSRFSPLEENTLYSYVTSYGFAAGSYGGYNIWRQQLALLIDTTPEEIWDNPRPGPFMELINFADNEGAIGSETSKKLYQDFVGWLDRATIHVPHDSWFFDRYRHWMHAFNLGADNGAVDFR